MQTGNVGNDYPELEIFKFQKYGTKTDALKALKQYIAPELSKYRLIGHTADYDVYESQDGESIYHWNGKTFECVSVNKK